MNRTVRIKLDYVSRIRDRPKIKKQINERDNVERHKEIQGNNLTDEGASQTEETLDVYKGTETEGETVEGVVEPQAAENQAGSIEESSSRGDQTEHRD